MAASYHQRLAFRTAETEANQDTGTENANKLKVKDA